MKKILVHILVIVAALFIAAYFIDGFQVTELPGAALAAVLLIFANFFIRPILILLTLPLTILTLGLFSFIINGAILKGVASLVDGFAIHTWTAAILGSIVIAVARMIIHTLLPKEIDGE